jgi:hypothetical protein
VAQWLRRCSLNVTRATIGFRCGNLNPTNILRQPIVRYSPILIMPPAGPPAPKRSQPGSTRDSYSVRLRCSKKQPLTGLSENTEIPVCQKREVRAPSYWDFGGGYHCDGGSRLAAATFYLVGISYASTGGSLEEMENPDGG